MELRHACVPLALACACALPPVQAAEGGRSPALDRASFWVGAAYGYPTVRAGTDAFGGSFQAQAVGFSDERTLLPRLRADLVLGARHGLSFDYYELRSARSAQQSSSFRFQGTEYTTDARVGATIDADVLTAAYRFWLGSGDTVLGLGVGAGFYRLDLSVEARASVIGGAFEARAGTAEEKVAPLLSAGLRHALSSRTRLYADASGIWSNGDSSSGHIYNAAIGLEWFPWRNVGFGFEYGVKRIRLEREGSAQTRLELELDKPTFFLRARF